MSLTSSFTDRFVEGVIMNRAILFVLVLISFPVLSESKILDVGPPFSSEASTTIYYGVLVSLPKTIVGDCVQGGGMGKIAAFEQRQRSNGVVRGFDEIRIHSDGRHSYVLPNHLSPEAGDRITYFKTFLCTYPVVTVEELKNSEFSSILSTIDFFATTSKNNAPLIYPGFAVENSDLDSSRYLDYTDGDFFISNSHFNFGKEIDPAYYEGSPSGQLAVYYTLKMTCGALSNSIPRLQERCSDAAVLEKAKTATTGPTQTLMTGGNSQFFKPPY